VNIENGLIRNIQKIRRDKMISVQEIEEQYKEKQSIFKKIFNLNSNDIKKIIKKIIDRYLIDFSVDDASVKKTIVDDEPYDITLSFYDSITISFCGIYYRLEHGLHKFLIDLYNDLLK
jgi:hypothetical protein